MQPYALFGISDTAVCSAVLLLSYKTIRMQRFYYAALL